MKAGRRNGAAIDRWLLRLLAVVVPATLVLVRARPVRAHVLLLDANPKPGSSLAAPPGEIRLTFSDALEAGSTFDVVDEDFAAVPGFDPGVDPADPRQLWAPVPTGALEGGTYTVQWAVSGPDGDPIRGSFAFAVERRTSDNSLPALAAGTVVVVAVGAGLAFWRRRYAADKSEPASQ